MPDWNELRVRLSHDLVKNRLIPGTTRMVRIVSGSVIEDPVETFDLIITTVWAETNESLQVLFDTCESALSPRNYFLVEPLVYCPPSTMEWLPDLIHELWLERHDIRGWSEAGKTLADELNLAIQNAGELLQYYNADDRKGDLLEAFVVLQNRTASLSAHLSAIDSKSLI